MNSAEIKGRLDIKLNIIGEDKFILLSILKNLETIDNTQSNTVLFTTQITLLTQSIFLCNIHVTFVIYDISPILFNQERLYMRNKPKRLDSETEVDMTPMLDIVFIMLIFFIVTTSFVKESGINIDRPSKSDDLDRKEKTALLIKVSGLDDVNFGGRDILLDAVQANVEIALSRDPKVIFLIQTAEKADVGVVVKIVDQVRLAGVTKVSVSRL